MAAQVWEFDPDAWPATFGRKWLWTIFAEKVHHARVVQMCVDGGITDLVILVNDSPADQPTFSVRTGLANTVALSQKLRSAGVAVHLSSWLDPTEKYVRACAEGMAEAVKACKARSLILDLEGEFRHRISNHGHFVAATMAPAFADFPVPIGITSFAVLPREVVPAVAWAVEFHRGFGQPQAYSVFQGKKWQFSTTIQPDHLTSRAWKTWSPLTRRLVCLLAAYGDPVPGRRIKAGKWAGKKWGVVESMEVAAQRAEVDGFPEIGWWSEEALSKKNAEAAPRLASIAQVRATGKSMLGRAWKRVLAVGAGVLAVVGGIAVAVRRSR